MSYRLWWIPMIVVAILLALCALSLDNHKARRCEEQGGQWKAVNGAPQCVKPR